VAKPGEEHAAVSRDDGGPIDDLPQLLGRHVGKPRRTVLREHLGQVIPPVPPQLGKRCRLPECGELTVALEAFDPARGAHDADLGHELRPHIRAGEKTASQQWETDVLLDGDE
jgi:hypothetical protein